LRKKPGENFTVKDIFESITGLKNPPPEFLEERLKRNPPPSPAEHIKVHYAGTIDSKSQINEAVIHARDGEYSLVLRFKSIGTENNLSDLARCEEFGSHIIENLESASNLD